jgi:hypothetical protein
LLANEPSLVEIVADVLEAAGYAQGSLLDHKAWTPDLKEALEAALEDYTKSQLE